ncbi:MAG TPA: Crp/Fnr family transcriptional regulator [Chitinophagaceae bacterium]|nr:Crp/Fnr family transcriptional regulator [Chitinophagaceae bacterium]
MSNQKLLKDHEAWAVLHKFIQRYVHFSEAEFRSWQSFFEVRTFDKKQVVTALGEQEEYINIIVSGLVRKYALLEKGEVTMQIAPEGHMIHAEWSFHQRQPSGVIVETIEPTTFISISYKNLQAWLDKYPKAEHMSRLFVTEMFIIKDRRYLEMLKKSTREIFLDYIKTHPHMLQRVPQKYLASYLNIKPETFSRLKHLLRSSRPSA